MITYKRIPYTRGDASGYRYLKGNLITKSSRVPQEVMDKFEINDSIEFDDKPGIPRCLFCDAPKTHQTYLTGLMVDRCDYHYYNRNIGQIAQYLREAKEKKDGDEAHSQQREAKRLKRARRQRKDARQNSAASGQTEGRQGTSS